MTDKKKQERNKLREIFSQTISEATSGMGILDHPAQSWDNTLIAQCSKKFDSLQKLIEQEKTPVYRTTKSKDCCQHRRVCDVSGGKMGGGEDNICSFRHFCKK